ncbi:MafI family immunity protein [Streptomyces sp. NPDC051162]|uniref:MafI family immunity protein n=1 Tax=Streptomyces sp. NPDC051162 TaxID=3154747 RepID=UPI003437E3C0
MTEEQMLRDLAGLLASHVSAGIVEDFMSYLDAGEPVVGFEVLCDALLDEEEPLTATEGARIRALGNLMGVTRASFRDIDELVVDD